MKKSYSILIDIGLSAVLSIVITLLTSGIQLPTDTPINLIGKILANNSRVDYTIGFPTPMWVHAPAPPVGMMGDQKMELLSGWPLNICFYFLISFLIIHMSRRLFWKINS